MSSSASAPTATANAEAARHTAMANQGEIVLIILAVFFGIFFLWLGYNCALLWYYKGNLGPEPKRYVIVPTRLKEKLDVLKRKSQQIEDPNVGNRRFTMFPAPSRWNGSTLVEINTEEEKDEDRDEEIRRAKAEEARISRLPVFEQDDCGDGSNFPDVPEVDPTQYLMPDPAPRFRPRTNYMTMGLRKLDSSSWLRVDNTYREFYDARSTLLFNRRAEVVQVLPEGEAGCEELMREVVDFLTNTYPQLFEIVERVPGRPVVRNKTAQEELALTRPYDCHPLEMCARLAMEDFNILTKSKFTGQHNLWASATLFPAGWRMRERIGKSVTDLHGPVPLWKDLPDILSQTSYFSRLDENSCMERNTFFVQVDPGNVGLEDLLFIQSGKDFFPGSLMNLNPRWILIRRERQTFRRLPKSGAIVFTVKTSIQKLTDVPESERRGLVEEIKSWPEDVANYKGRDLWETQVYRYCEGKLPITIEHDVDLNTEAGISTL